jgi:hypothetical protein
MIIVDSIVGIDVETQDPIRRALSEAALAPSAPTPPSPASNA